MQSTATYNSVKIKDVLTDSIQHVAVKESTGVDQLGVEVTVSLTGVIHAAQNDQIGYRATSPPGGGPTQTFGPALASVIQKLTKDCRPFKMQLGNSILYNIMPGAIEPGFPNPPPITGQLIDVDNGPRPQVEVLQIISGVSAKIRFQVRFVITNCDGAGALNRNGLLLFRFWIAENVNCQNWLTTRRYQGIIRVAHKNVSPHALARTITIPSLEDGFVRRVVQWDESSNGLELAFTYEDQEVVATPPYNKFADFGATAWTGRLVHSTDTLGATSIIEAQINLEGPKGTSILELADIAIRVIAQKIQYAKLVKGQQAYFLDFSIAEEFHANVLECSAKIRHTGNQADFIGLFHLGNSPVIGQPMGNLGIGYDSGVGYQPGPSAGTKGLFTSLKQIVCRPNAMPQIATEPPPRYRRRRNQDRPPSQRQESSNSYPTDLSASQQQNMYFDYRIESEYKFDSGRIALATGSASNSQGPTQSIVNLYRSRCNRHVRCVAARLNAPPELPDFRSDFTDLLGIKNTRIGEAHLSPVVPQLSADGRNLLYEVSLEALYAMDRPPQPGERIAVGAIPYRKVSETDASRALPPAIFLPPESLLS
jgi:hypothetical protein